MSPSARAQLELRLKEGCSEAQTTDFDILAGVACLFTARWVRQGGTLESWRATETAIIPCNWGIAAAKACFDEYARISDEQSYQRLFPRGPAVAISGVA